MGKNGVEVIEYAGQVWINQKNHEKKTNLVLHIYLIKLNIIPQNLKIGVWKLSTLQKCIENTLAVERTISSVKTQAAIFRDGFEVNQHNKVLCKQQSLGLRLKKLFPSEDIEEYFTLHYRIDFKFKNHMLMVEIDEKGHADKDPAYEKKRQKELENCGY